MKTTLKLWIVALLVSMGLPIQSEDLTVTEKATLERLFTQAAATNGATYLILRSNILEKGGAVISMLRAKSTSTNLHERVAANGMIIWLEKSTNCQEQVKRNEASLAYAHRYIAGIFPGVQNASGYVYKNRPRIKQLGGALFEPYNLEMALKRAWPVADRTPAAEESDAIWAQCYATGVLGICEGQDVLRVLKELSKSDQWELRASCVMSLRYLNTVEATELLFQMVTDQNAEVRGICRVGIKDLTDQDFGDAPGQYRLWWAENKAKWPFVGHKPSEKSIRLK